MLTFLMFEMEDGRHVGKYWKYHNSSAHGSIWTKLVWSLVAFHHVLDNDMSAVM